MSAGTARMRARVGLMGRAHVEGEVEPSDLVGGGIKVTVGGVVRHFGPGAVYEVTPLDGDDEEPRWDHLAAALNEFGGTDIYRADMRADLVGDAGIELRKVARLPLDGATIDALGIARRVIGESLQALIDHEAGFPKDPERLQRLARLHGLALKRIEAALERRAGEQPPNGPLHDLLREAREILTPVRRQDLAALVQAQGPAVDLTAKIAEALGENDLPF